MHKFIDLLNKFKNSIIDKLRGLFSYYLVLIISILFIATLGIIGTIHIGNYAEREKRSELSKYAKSIAVSINPNHLNAHEGNNNDSTKDEWKEIRNQLIMMQSTSPDISFIHTMSIKGNQIVFTNESTIPNSIDYAGPGVPYYDAPKELYQIYKSGEELFLGPYSDKRGTFFSVFIPIRNPKTNYLIGFLGVGISASKWYSDIRTTQIAPAVVTFVISVLQVLLFIFLKRKRDVHLALQKANDDLEIHVIERTSELSQINEELKKSLSFLKNSQDALKESEVKFRTIFNSTDNAIVILEEGLIIECNQRFFQLFGLKLFEVINYSLSDFSPFTQPNGQNSYQKIKEKIDLTLKYSSQSFEWQFCRKNGNTLLTEIVFNRIAFSGKLLIQCVIKDITEQKRIEQVLRESEKRFRALIENSSDMISLFNKDGSLIYNSPSIERILGWKPEEMLNRTVIEFIHPDDLQSILNEQKTIFEEPNSHLTIQVRFLNKNGSWHYLEACIDNLLDTPGVHAIVTNSRDITRIELMNKDLIEKEKDLQEAYNKLQKAYDGLDALSNLKNEFISFICHELRTPLTKLSAYQLIHFDNLKPEESELYQMINEGYQQLDKLIAETISYFSLVSVVPILKIEKIDIKEIINFVKTNHENEIKEKNLSFIFNCEHDLKADVDNQSLTNILNVVLDNAIKFNVPNGKITIDSQIVDNKLGITITDSGIGMPPGITEYVFSPFATQNINFHSGGIGLSLSYAKNLIYYLGGDINAYSEGEGLGSKFTIEIPINLS